MAGVIDQPGNALAKLETATRMLAEARTLDEVRQIRDLAEAARAYAKAAGLGDEAIGYASAIKLDAERKAGQVLADMKAKGERAAGRPEKQSPPVTLPDLGVTPMQSSRWQALARLPELEYREVRQQVASRSRGATERASREAVASEFDQVVEAAQTEASRRKAALLEFAAATVRVSQLYDRIVPAPTQAELAEYQLVTTLAAVVRRLEAGAGVKKITHLRQVGQA